MSMPTAATASHRLRLSGNWEVCAIPLESAVNPQHLPTETTLSVPECAHLQPLLYPENPYWGGHVRAVNQQAWLYRRTFASPTGEYQRARLRFEGVDYFASVWLNGQSVGEHEGGFAPFTVDVTGALNPAGDNHLLVKVSAPWDAPNPRGTYPSDHVIRGLVKGLYEHGEGVIPPDVNPLGIWRPVWLRLDDGVRLDRVRVATSLSGQIDLTIAVTNDTGAPWEGVLDLRIAAETHDGPGAAAVCPLRLPPGARDLHHTLHVPEPRLWWPHDQGQPDLYRLEAALLDRRNRPLDSASSTFGIRTVSLERSRERFVYRINERPVFIRGTSYMPALYLSQCDAASLARDVALAKDAHLNLLRVHVHVSPPELYDQCDRAGMLVWQDFELNWVHDSSRDFERRALALQRDMMDHLYNHPSLITWCCHNEPTMLFARRHNLERHPDPALYRDAQTRDSTRPIFICSGQMADDWRRAGDVHSYYGGLWSRRYTDIYRHHFRLNSEFGFEAPAALTTLRRYPAVWERLKHLEGEIDALWGYQAELIQYQVEHLRRLRASGCAGYIHFWLADLVPQVGCGVLDADRLPKGGYAALRAASQPLHVALEHDGRRPYRLWAFNDTPQTYPNATLSWQVQDTDGHTLFAGEYRCDIAANQSQPVADVSRTIPRRCARLELSIQAADGSVLATNVYYHPFQPTPRPAGYPWKFDPFLGTKVFDRPDAPSLANYNVPAITRVIPLGLRERLAEWVLRQQLPSWLLSALSRLIDRTM
jgi:beta-mannosidase